MVSALYCGHVRHRRVQPIEHVFTHRLFMLYVDLGELPTLFAGRWLWSVDRANVAAFHRADYMKPSGTPLRDVVLQRVQEATGDRPCGPVRMLTHLRYFGYCFNPVTLYYCFESDGVRLHSIVADITNTPWGQRHAYVVRCAAGGRVPAFDKTFHVSPFLDMALCYHWRFTAPEERLTAHMDTRSDGRTILRTTLALRRREITPGQLARTLLQYPAMTLAVIMAIYYQAARLRWKGAPFFKHPDRRSATESLP